MYATPQNSAKRIIIYTTIKMHVKEFDVRNILRARSEFEPDKSFDA